MKKAGQTLDALRSGMAAEGAANWNLELFRLLNDEEDGEFIAAAKKHHGVLLLGRSHDELCYFGVEEESNARSQSNQPVVLMDNKLSDPEICAKNLGDFLSLIAYSPSTWGSSPKEWADCAAAAEADHGEDAARLRAFLLTLPGVKETSSPWLLQKKLPKLTSAITKTAGGAGVGDLWKAFFEGATQLLLVFDGIEEREDDIAINIIVDAPKETHATLQTHDVVLKPLKAFLAKVRAEIPNQKFKLRLTFEELGSETRPRARDDVWKSLRLALGPEGAPLFRELTRLRR